MSQDNYGALMLKRALATTVNLATVKAPGVYPVDAGNATAPGSAAGELLVYLPTAQTKQEFISAAGAKFVRGSALGSWVELVPSTRKINSHSLDRDFDITAGDVDAIPDGSISGGPNAPAWNAKSGMYNLSVDGASQMIFHLNQGVGSCPAAQIKFDYKNRGIWYRTARDKFGFEADWSGFYTTTNKPSAADVGALSIAGGAMTGAITGLYTESSSWADQYRTKAPFFDDYASTAGSAYRPIIKQRATTTGNSWAFSMGTLLSGGALSWHLHIRGSSGFDINHRWATDGNYYAANQLIPANYANYDARYYTKSQSDAAYMAKTSAYTKAEVDSRVNARGAKNTASNGQNGWWRCGDTGRIEQQALSTSVGGQTVRTVNFPIPFPNACLNVVIAWANTGSQMDYPVRITSWTKTGVSYVADGGGAVSLQAVGF